MSDSIETTWKLDGTFGRLNSRAFSATLDLNQPQYGLTQISIQQRAVIGRLLSVRRDDADVNAWPVSFNEAYLRGDDLVAAYTESNEWPYAPQIYWRAESVATPGPLLASLGLLISVQTHLLDTHPRISVSSRIAADEIVRVIPLGEGQVHAAPLHVRELQTIDAQSDPCCLLWRLEGDEISYAEIMLARDFRRLEVCRREEGIEATWRVFSEFLEKGVIRRARLQAAFLPRKDDALLAAALCRAACSRPLPLTT